MIDLHLHSTFSDGSLSPEQLVREAKKANLSAIALTDHDSVSGVALFLEACVRENIRGIAGVEISVDYPHGTMRGMISMLTDRNYRQLVVEYIQDDMVKRFWAIEFADWSEKYDTEAIIPLVNKLAQFLSDPALRGIFGQEENKVDLEKLMTEGKIILINLCKGKLGEENASFFGSMFITKIKQAGMARAALPE